MQRRSAVPFLLAALAGLEPVAAAAAEGGLQIFPDVRMVYLIVFFLVLMWPLDRLLFRPLLGVLDERRERIEGARKRAEGLEGEADEVLGRYETAVDKARSEAEVGRREQLDLARREQTRLTSEARSGAEQEVSRARGDIAAAVAEARQQLRGEATALAREAAARVLGRDLS